MEKKLIATGIDVNGEEKKFYCELLRLWCVDRNLISLTIPEGIRQVYCWNNHIAHLNLPNSVTDLYADKEVTNLEKYIGTEMTIHLK